MKSIFPKWVLHVMPIRIKPNVLNIHVYLIDNITHSMHKMTYLKYRVSNRIVSVNYTALAIDPSSLAWAEAPTPAGAAPFLGPGPWARDRAHIHDG